MKTWQPFLLTLLLSACTTLACAGTPAHQAGEQLLGRYLAALQRHDLRALDGMITRHAPFEVTWLDSTPPKRFTMTRDDYLQQVKATWHFGSNEKLSMSKTTWLPGPTGGTLLARFRLDEQRIILGSTTGQSSDLELVISPEQGQLKITAIRTRTRTW